MVFDGQYICYRSYFGHKDLFLEDRETHVGAVYGFFKQLKNYYSKYRPKKIVVSWDSRNNIRKKMYSGYKDNRKKDPGFDKDSFYCQIKIIKSILNDMGISQIEKDGYESDDVMSEFCNKIILKRKDLKFIIVTTDHDLFQIINENINILRPLKNGEKLYNLKTFQLEYGITPEQYLQSMWISGCKTDNVPGVDGVGPKTAINIIKSIGDISNINNFEKIKGISEDRFKLIKDSKNEIMFTKSLVTIFKDFSFEMKRGEKNLSTVRDTFKNYLKFESFLFDWDCFVQMCD